jgi:hypothetical protein
MPSVRVSTIVTVGATSLLSVTVGVCKGCIASHSEDASAGAVINGRSLSITVTVNEAEEVPFSFVAVAVIEVVPILKKDPEGIL